MNVNGVPRLLGLGVDANGQLVNSIIDVGSKSPHAIIGTYDNTTGRLAFTEFFPFPTETVPSYVGYGWVDSNGLGTVFAGTFVEYILVCEPNGFCHFEFLERGWYAISGIGGTSTRGNKLTDPTGGYTADVNGDLNTLYLEVDSNGQLVNSLISPLGGQQSAVVGTYDKTTGRIDFSVVFPFPTPPQLVPRFEGYGVTSPLGLGTFKILAGIFTEMKLVPVAPPGHFHFEFVEHGWIAITDAPSAGALKRLVAPN